MVLSLTLEDFQTLLSEGYQYVRTLGQGQYGLVLLATRNERKLALKVTRNIKSFQSEVLILTGDRKSVV